MPTQVPYELRFLTGSTCIGEFKTDFHTKFRDGLCYFYDGQLVQLKFDRIEGFTTVFKMLEVYEDTLDVAFDANSDFAFFDLVVNGVSVTGNLIKT